MLTEVRVSVSELVRRRPRAAASGAISFCDSLAATIIEEFTEPNDMIFDPFAGYGTSLVVARRLGQQAIGIELGPERVAIIRRRVGPEVSVLCGDVRDRLADVPEQVQTQKPVMFGYHQKMTETTHRQHEAADHEHRHGEGCGHECVQHGDHVDYLHDGHRHAEHDDHYDEHEG